MKWNAKDPAWSELVRVYLFSVKRARPHITIDEMAVLMFVFERTYGYKKEQERISLKHFLEGVHKSNSPLMITSRVGLSKTNLLRAIRHLLGKGIIQVHNEAGGGCNWYTVSKPEQINWHQVAEYVKENQPDEIEKGNVLQEIWVGLED